MQKQNREKKRKFYLQTVLVLMFCILTGCAGTSSGEGSRDDPKEPESGAVSGRENREADTVLIFPKDEEIRSMWVEKDELYVFTAAGSETGKMQYRLCLVKDGSLSDDTKYKETMGQFIREELGKADAVSLEYEARFGRNGVVYLLGRNDEGVIKKCYWFSESYYARIPFDELLEGIDYKDTNINNIEISKSGRIYLAYNSQMCRYDQIYRGVGLESIHGQRFALGNLYIYELVPGRIYRWNMNGEYPPAEMVECDTLTDEDMPYFIDSGDNIYIAGSYGLSYLPHGGTIWEILMDTGTEGFDSTAFDLKQIWINGQDLYLLGQDLETEEWKILKHQLP